MIVGGEAEVSAHQTDDDRGEDELEDAEEDPADFESGTHCARSLSVVLFYILRVCSGVRSLSLKKEMIL